MRRIVVGGFSRGDVSRALSELAKRNLELNDELAAARAAEQQLLERARTAEETLDSFHGLLQQASNLLAMAEERACEVRVEAERDSAQLRAEVEALQQELVELEARKLRAMDDLVRWEPAPAYVPDPEPEPEPLPEPVELAPVLAFPEPAPDPVDESKSLEELFLQHVEANRRS